jgi:alpha-1,6-mannosyltransferase
VKVTARWPALTWTNLALVVLGSASVFLYRHALQAEGQGAGQIIWIIKLTLIQSSLFFAAAWIAWRASASRSTLIVVVAFAALFRASILFAPPMLSDDIYRYIWDGRVQGAGFNPYRYVPADEALAHLRDEAIYPNINRAEHAPTIYPPVAQAFYFIVTRVSESVTWMKASLVACEVVGLWALAALLSSFGLAPQRLLLAAWHPLMVWEIAGSGHVDALMIMFIALALLARQRGSETMTGIALAGATLVKFFPVLLFPALYRRWGWRMPAALVAVIAVSYLPYLGVGHWRVLGFLPDYSEEEGLASGQRFFILALARRIIDSDIPNSVYLVFSLTVLVMVAAWCLYRRAATTQAYVSSAFALAITFTALLAPRYAWYFVWLVPFLCLSPTLPVFYLTGVSFILYGTWLGDSPDKLFTINASMYGPFAVLVIAESLFRYVVRGRSRSRGADSLPREFT